MNIYIVMFSNNISAFSSNPGGKSLFHQSVYVSSSINNATVDSNKIYNLLYGLESRITDSVSAKVLESEDRTVNLLNNMFSIPLTNNNVSYVNASRNSVPATQIDLQLEESYLTVINSINNSIEVSYEEMIKKIIKKINDEQFYTRGTIDSVYKSVKHNNVLIKELGYQFNKKLDVIDNNVSGIANSISVLLSAAVSQIKSAINAALFNTESKLLSGQSVLSGEISSAESKIVGIQTALSSAESKVLSGQSALSSAISSTESKVLSVQTAISRAESKILSGHIDIENLIKAIPIHNCCCKNEGGCGTGEGTAESKMIHELVISNCVSTIIGYYSNFALGNFDEVRENLTIETFETLSKQLFLFKSSLADTSDYEIVRNIIVKSFEALMQMIKQFVMCTELEVKLEAANKKAAILDDVQALEDYIKKLEAAANINILPEVSFTAPLFTVKPEIQRYIDLYGFPEGGVFDVDKLGELIPN